MLTHNDPYNPGNTAEVHIMREICKQQVFTNMIERRMGSLINARKSMIEENYKEIHDMSFTKTLIFPW